MVGLAYLAEHKARHRPVHPCLVAVGRAICRSATAVQRVLSVAIGRRIAGKRDKADVQLGGRKRLKRQLYQVQQTSSSGWTVSMFRLRLTRRANRWCRPFWDTRIAEHGYRHRRIFQGLATKNKGLRLLVRPRAFALD